MRHRPVLRRLDHQSARRALTVLGVETNSIFGTRRTNWQRNGLFLITNAGSRSVEVTPNIGFVDQSSPKTILSWSYTYSPTNLARGQSIPIESPLHLASPIWRADITYNSRPVANRFANRVWGSKSSFMNNIGRRLIRAPEYDHAFTDWITNPPPSPRRLFDVVEAAAKHKAEAPMGRGGLDPLNPLQPGWITNPPAFHSQREGSNGPPAVLR